MRTVFGSTIVALLFAAAGAVCWTLGQAERALANAEQQLATMRYGMAADPAAGVQPTLRYAARIPVVGTNLVAVARDGQATAEYWLQRYEALTAQRDAGGTATSRDPQQLLLASHASFRATQAETMDRQTALGHLDAVIKNYAEALKATPGNSDAAYNYEFVVRTRDALARARGTTGASKTNVAEATPTIHGRPGAPPKGVTMSSFKVMVPKRSDERKDGEEPGKGGEKVRKG